MRSKISKWTLVAGVILVTCGLSGQVASAQVSKRQPHLRISTSGDRSHAAALNGASVSGKIAVFVTGPKSIKSIAFYLDNASATGTPRQVENSAPYDFAGTSAGGSATLFDTAKLSSGTHEIEALISRKDGAKALIKAKFSVGAATTTTSSSSLPATSTTTSKPTTTTVPPTTSTTKPISTTTSTTAPSTGTVSPGIAPPSGKTWSLAFSQEFNGTDYDHTKLTPCFDWNTGDCTSSFNNGRETYRPSQVTVSGGAAHLKAEPLSPAYASSACQNGSCTYKSGLLSTARPSASNGSDYLYKFTYGYVEANMKIPHKQGFFTAFWMLPANKSYDYNTEIDILENLGYDTKTMYQTYHYAGRDQNYTPNTGTGNNGACPVIDYSTDFHRVGVDWEPNHVAFYLDGKMCGQYTNAANIENGPMQIILDMMVDNNWQRSWNEGLTDPAATATWDIDYLRVYQAH